MYIGPSCNRDTFVMNRIIKVNFRSNFIILILFASFYSAAAQVPQNSFYHSRETVLPYASLSVLYPDGSQYAIPFTPVIVNQKPTGIYDFSRDFEVGGRLVFSGNGIVCKDREYNAYGDYNLQGRIPLIVYNYPSDFKQRYGEVSDLHIRIYEAELRGAAAVILFGMPYSPGWFEPFIVLPPTRPEITIPVYSISFTEAQGLLHEGGYNLDIFGNALDQLFSISPVELPLTRKLRIKSGLESVQSEHFKKRYLPGVLNEDLMTYVAELEEKALLFVEQFLHLTEETESLTSETTYFPDFTSLRFFTGITKDEYTNNTEIYNVYSLQNHYNHPIQNEYFHTVDKIALPVIRKA